MASLLPIRFRTELARSFHRDIVSTLNVPDGELNTLNTLDSTMFTFTAAENTTTFSGDDIKGHTLAYTPGRIDVYVDGDKVSTEDFDALDGTTIDLHTATGEEETTVELTGITFSYTAVDNATDVITKASHGFTTGDSVTYYQNGGDAITGLTNASTYYVITLTANTLQLATSLANATAGTEILLTAGTGTVYLLVDTDTDDINITSLTIPTAGIATATDTITYTTHGLLAGDRVVYYNGGGASATGLTSGTTYYVIASGLTANAFKVSATSGGSAVNITGTGNAAQYFETADEVTIAAHGFGTGNEVQYEAASTGSIVGLTEGTTYYIIKIDDDTVKFATSLANATAGTAIYLQTPMALGTFLFTGPLTQTVTVNTFTLYNYPNPRDYFYVFLGKPTVWASLTIPMSGVTTATDTFAYAAHGLTAGRAVVYYNGGGASATGLTSGTTYYVIASGLTANAFKVSATSGGSTVNITGTGNNAQYFETADSTPDTPVDTRMGDSAAKRNIMGVKKINPSDTCLMVRRVNWETGTVYVAYTDDADLSDEDFYVFNVDNYRIYKCLDNDNDTASTTKPAFSELGPKTLADGYTWQLIYEVPTADRTKFLNDDFIPIKFYGTSTRFDHNGTISEVICDAGGTGYTSSVTILIIGDGVGAEATATVDTGVITSIAVTNGGSGYSFAFVLIIGDGSGALASTVVETTDLPNVINQNVAGYAVATSGQIDFISITTGGTNYLTTTTSVVIEGDGSGATASVVATDGGITAVTITDRGSGYTFANVLISGDGTGAALKAMVSPQGGHGANIPQELFATTLGISVNVEDFLTDFFLDNDFRQYGVIKNIRDYSNETLFNSNTGNACHVITVPDGTEYNLDDEISSDNSGSFIVSYVSGNTVYLLPVINSTLTTSTLLTNDTESTSGLTLTEVIPPEIGQRTGDIIYLNNIASLARQIEQTETIKLYINF